ncbi:MAG: tRNA (N6-isopentenyl adenosine(37)-C2)-methylthiotransferase MiaB [Alphaproteobacteria bacterium GM7ARS4]|nr:tRNA (N6-isopentenyl adenosine(37)-C2)-methylthiotransferase MiaB [Alphaproteobacteria bacterium GM7ARS4]
MLYYGDRGLKSGRRIFVGGTVFLKTYGCQMNVYDSERVRDMLDVLGYRAVESPQHADILVMNSCHIREKAEEKVYSELGTWRLVKEKRRDEGRETTIAVMGCVAQAEGREMKRRAPFVDIIMGPQSYHLLPEVMARLHRLSSMKKAKGARDGMKGAGVMRTSFAYEEKFDALPPIKTSRVSALMTVQEGCDRFCHFCVVPYTRGAEWSRPVEAVLEEARQRVRHGAREIVLLGQNVNAYHGCDGRGGTLSLAGVIERLALIDGLERIRYTTSHPADMRQDLIDAHGDIPQLMPFVHLPVQSGSDRVLKAMNRRHTADDYRRIIDKLRHRREDIAFSSDFIVGFVNETEEDFTQTLDMVRDVGFASGFSFCYSPRHGTPAAMRPTGVSTSDAQRRLKVLQDVLEESKTRFHERLCGMTIPVLVEEKKEDGTCYGRSPWMQSVHIDAWHGEEAGVGTIRHVSIHRASPHSVYGRLESSMSSPHASIQAKSPMVFS